LPFGVPQLLASLKSYQSVSAQELAQSGWQGNGGGAASVHDPVFAYLSGMTGQLSLIQRARRPVPPPPAVNQRIIFAVSANAAQTDPF